MRAVRPRRRGAVLAASVLSIVLLAGCEARLRGVESAPESPADGTVPAAGVAPTTQARQSPEGPRTRGRILDELGTPPAATVYVLRWQGDRAEEGPVTDAVAIVTTDANGEFAFDRTIPASGEVRIDVAGLAPRSMWFGVESGILMLGTRTLQGFVHDPEGRAVAGALVRVHVIPEKGPHRYDGASHSIRVRTRSDGSYRFDRLPGGRCRIWVEERTPEGEAWFEEEHWTFATSEPVARVDLGSPKRQPRATVRVRAAPGGELRRLLWFGFRSGAGRGYRASENADGTYSVRLPPGSYEVLMAVGVEGDDGVVREGEAALNGADGRPASVEVRAGAPDPTFDLYLPAK